MSDVFVFHEKVIEKHRAELVAGDCLAALRQWQEDSTVFDAVVTDPPYEIALHGKEWDNTGIAFSQELWSGIYSVLKPGGFVAAFSATRLYHRLAVAIEDAGFKLYPFLSWQFPGGLQKPINLSELFDRENVPNREPIGWRKGSGYTTGNVKHGAQNRSGKLFPVYERLVSEEARQWEGYYYGVNAMRPTMEPIVLAQKPIAHDRMIDNVREFGTGALNIGALKERMGEWPGTILTHKKARQADHGSNHPSVKPVGLMEDLCLLACPAGGHILDPFAGTGTTGVAAQELGFRCTLVERNPEMQPVIQRRLGLSAAPDASPDP